MKKQRKRRYRAAALGICLAIMMGALNLTPIAHAEWLEPEPFTETEAVVYWEPETGALDPNLTTETNEFEIEWLEPPTLITETEEVDAAFWEPEAKIEWPDPTPVTETNEYEIEFWEPNAEEAQNAQGDLSLAALAARVLPAEDTPDAVPAEMIETNGHVNRLWEQEADLNSILFQNRDGTKTMYLFADAVKYVDENGMIRDKRNTISDAIDKPQYRNDYAFYTDANDVKTYFPKTLSADTGVLLEAEDIKIEMSPVSETAATSASKSASTVSFDSVFGADTSIRYTPQFDGFKEDIILNHYTGVNEFTFRLKTNGLSLVPDERGGYVFIEPLTGKVRAKLGYLSIYDSKPRDIQEETIGEGVLPQYNHHYEITAIERDNEYLVTIAADESYLIDKERIWPVYIDPNITVSGSGVSKTIQDAPVYSNYPATSYGGSNPAYVGYSSAYGIARTLMKFPGLASDSTYAGLTAGQITSLDLYMYETSGTTSARIDLWQYTGAAWTESSATCGSIGWNSYSNNFTYANVSGAGWKTFSLMSMVPAWKSDPTALDKGIMIRNGTSEASTTYLKSFTTSESGSNQPYLSYTYNVNVTGVSITNKPASNTLLPNQSWNLSATVSPTNATNKTVTWTSSNTSVATVNATSGQICTYNTGTTTITATSAADSTKKDSFTLTVNPVAVTGVSIYNIPPSNTLNIGQTWNSYVTITPSNATNKAVTWTSSSTGVAMINSSGVISAVGGGTTTITATSVSNPSVYNSFTLMVPIPVTNVSITNRPAADTLLIGQTCNLSVSVLPSNATNQTVTWTSGSTGVATINASGVISAVNVGTTTITATSAEDSTKKDSFTLTVNPVPVTGVSITNKPASNTLFTGQSWNLSAAVSPWNATNPTVTWTSSNTSVAAIDITSGLICTHNGGSTTITVTSAEDNTKIDSFTLTVTVPVTSVTLYNKPASETLLVGQTCNLSVNVLPSNATNQTVTWTSSSTSVATINSSGVITAVSVGSTTITVTSVSNPSVINMFTLTVKPAPVTGVSITNKPAADTMFINQSWNLSANVTPTYAEDTTVTWKSSDTSVATVNSASGLICTYNAGTTTITATSVSNPSVTHWFTLTVTVPVESISITNKPASNILYMEQSCNLSAAILPSNATDQRVTWTSGNTNVATVSSSGVISAVSTGTTVITVASVSNPGVTNTFTLTVQNVPVTAVKITGRPAADTLSVNQTWSVSTAVSPINAYDKTVTWTSSNISVATVDANGLITTLSTGSTTIKATSVFNSGVYGSFTLTVTAPATTTEYVYYNAYVENMATFAGKTFKVQYNTTELQLIDFAAQTPELNTTAGTVANTDIQILTISNGVITFSVNKSVTAGKTWTGTATVIKFKALTSGNSTVVLTEQ